MLKDEPGRAIERVGDTIHRPTGWWTPSVHALLQHLSSVGFPFSPRVLGFDQEGREILTYIEGESGAHGWAAIVPEAGLRDFAALLRSFHEAVRTFRPSADLEWGFGLIPLEPEQIVCHGDFGPWNVVWREGRPVGILDWDWACPGNPMDDIAYALEYAVPFRDDVAAVQWHGFTDAPDRLRRIAIFAEAYGVDLSGSIVDTVLERMRLDTTRVCYLAAREVEPQATWVRDGKLQETENRMIWIEANRSLFE